MENDSLSSADYLKRKSHRGRLLLFILLAIIIWSGVAIHSMTKTEQLRKEREVVKAIQKLGGTVWHEGKGPPALVEARDDVFVYEVSLHGVHVKDADLQNFGDLTHLDIAYLDDTSVTDAGLEHLSELTQLTLLSLDNTPITDNGLEHLRKLTRLSELHIKGCKVTQQGVRRLKQALPNCEIER
jgi:hypothetical protein